MRRPPDEADRLRVQAPICQLKALRLENQLTQTEVAAQMGGAQSVVSDIESGSDLPVTTLYRYARSVGARLTVQVEARDA